MAVKKRNCIFVVLCLLAFPMSAEIFIAPSIGFSRGTLGEIVYVNTNEYADDTLSELFWDYAFLSAGVKTGVKGAHFLFENAVSYAIAAQKGSMTDSDYLNVQYSGLQDYQYKTNYSESDNVLCRAVSVNTKVAFEFNTASWLHLSPFGGVDFFYTRFRAENGWYRYGKETSYGCYAYNSSNSTSGTFSGTVMTYRRYDVMTWLGLESVFLPSEKSRVSLSAAFCPYYFAADIDNHVLRDITFVDFATGSFCAFKIGTETEYDVTDLLSLDFSVSYIGTTKIRGITYQKSSTEKVYKKTTGGESGMDLKNLNIAVSLKLRLFQ